jgi:tRNA A37 threonylcarbamoyladenosine biosynthesis protein TsaE
MKQYELDHPDFDQLVHIDAYRFETEAEAGPLRLTEVLLASRTIVCLEWPERIPTVIPKEAVRVSITLGKGEARVVKVQFSA